jgi:hypothetical protein
MKFVVFAHPFDDRVGGIIALHLLCQRLGEAGEVAVLWPFDRPRFHLRSSLRRHLAWIRYHVTRRNRQFERGPFATQIAGFGDLHDAVIVYPEVTTGNPLGASNVVRWLLHKPGFHTGKVDFGANDLLFFYQEAFHDPALGSHASNLLMLTWWNNKYYDRGIAERSGSAYLIKKGLGRPLLHNLEDSVLVDNLTHEERADVFNRCMYFYTYDPYTLYSRYAAVCGCIPVIIPPEGLSKEQWVPREEDRYGLAYGMQEVPWAVATRNLLFQRMARERAEENAMVAAFVAKCRERYEP